MPRDFDNKTLDDTQLYGDIPQGATISIFRKAELKGLTANPDAIPVEVIDADAKGKGGGSQITLTNIPAQNLPPDDIEAVLNAALDEPDTAEDIAEGFSDIEEGFQRGRTAARPAASASSAVAKASSAASAVSNIAPGNANAAKAASALTIAADPKAAAQAKANELVAAQAAKLGLPGNIPLRTFDTNTPQGLLAQKAQDKAIEFAKAQAQKQATKLKNAIGKRLKNSKLGKMAGKAVAKAKAVVLKGVKKMGQKITGMFAKKLGSKVGTKATAGIFKKLAAKIAAKVAAVAGKATSAATGLMTNPVTVALGVILSALSALAVVVGTTIPIILQGDEGVCKTGYRKIADVWPSFLDNVPFIGDIMGVIAPYVCFIDGCDAGEQEDAGLCYPPCDKGYDGVGPICWNHATETEPKGPGIPKGCPDGWQDDGALICKERSGRICGDDCGKGWDNCRRRGAFNECWGGCKEGCSDVYLGRWIGKMNNAKDGGNLLKCSGDREEVDFLTGQKPTDISVLPLCYGKCPLVGKAIGTVTTTKYPVYIKKRPSPNADAAQKALMDALAVKTTSTETLKMLQKAIGDAIAKDAVLPIPADAPYIRNPDGPRIGSETAAVTPPRRWPLQETQYYSDLLAGIENGRVVFYSETMGGWQTFETIFGGYGITFSTGNVKVKKITMTSVGPQVINASDQTMWRWVPKIMDWETTGWGIFKDLGAANNDFTYGIGTDDRPYIYRWKDQGPGRPRTGGGATSWYGMIGVAANDTGDTNRDHGNFYTTNPSGWHANFLDWSNEYMLGNDQTFDPVGLRGHKATDIAVTQDAVAPSKKNFIYYISTDKGSIFSSGGPDTADVVRSRNKHNGPLPGTPITAITVSTGFPTATIYVISGGRLFKGTHNPSNIAWKEIPGKTLTDIAIGPPVLNDQYTAFYNYTTYLQTMQSQVYSKYPIPSPTTPEDKIPILVDTVTTTSEERMKHIPLLPYLCMGNRGLAYGRGVGKPKLKLDLVTKTPPEPAEPPPPSQWMSAAFADEIDNPCNIDFSDSTVLQEMCDFYYQAAMTDSNVNADGSVSFGYITKITKVTGSSEQSADIICDITNIVVNMETGKTISSMVASGSDRRFYFAKMVKICKFIVVGATNANKTAPDVTTGAPTEVKVVSFTPIIQKCANIPIGLKKCQGQDSVEAMIAMYKKTLPPTVRIMSVDAVQDSGTDVCAVAWKEVTFDPNTNVESTPMVKVGKFKFQQDKSNDACAYKLQSYSAGDPNETVKALAKPIIYDAPTPPDVTLQGCATTCKDPEMLKKLVDAFNAQPGSNRILAVSKVVTPSQLRCDIEADVFVAQTKATEKQKIRFDLAKDQASCVFTVKTVGAAGSGTFIQNNTNVLDAALSTKDFVTSAQTEAVKSAQTNLAAAASKITEKQGEANTAYESTFSQFGQVETLGSCPKKCSDPDILNAIITYYNNANYPKTRAGVTKKTVGRVLKAGTAGKNICDILFEEKQEKYNDLYTDTPTVNVTQKTQRFTMKDVGGCQFVVDSQEGFTSGLPMREGFQVTKAPSVVNTRTPSLNPVYTGTGCELDCTTSEVMTAMKQKYQSANIEGFQGRSARGRSNRGFFSNLFANFSEAFQDVAEGGDPVAVVSEEVAVSEEAPVVSEETPVVETPADQGTADWNAAATEEVAVEETAVVEADASKPKVVKTTNMKKVNRVLKLGVDKCEYEVVYDSTDTDSNGNTTAVNDAVGYFTAVFTKDATGCSFSPSQVTKSTKPIITTVPNTKTANIAFSF